MDERLSRMVDALSPVMNPIQAEGFLHVTAFTCHKSLNALTAEDWPSVEVAIRETLGHASRSQSPDEIEAAVTRMRAVFLEGANGFSG